MTALMFQRVVRNNQPLSGADDEGILYNENKNVLYVNTFSELKQNPLFCTANIAS